MVTRLAPKLALTTAAALALYVPTLISPQQDSCTWTAGVVGEGSGPVTYVFGSDGTVKMSEGPMSWLTTRSGDCSGSDSRTNPATEGSATWSALG